MSVIPVFIYRHRAEVPCHDTVQTAVDPKVALQDDRKHTLSVNLIARGFHLFTGSIEAIFRLNVFPGDSQSIHDFLIKHDTHVAALFHHIDPNLIIRREYLSVIFGFHMAGIRIPAAVGIRQSLLDILREILQKMGVRIIGFQERLHIPYLISRHQLLVHVRIRNGHDIRQFP